MRVDPMATARHLALPATLCVTSVTLAQSDVRYSEHIRPILSNQCFECHGPDPETRMAGLRLDLRDEATADRGGYAAIVPGDPDASEIWLRVTADHHSAVMPPLSAGRARLTDDEQSLIRRWIAAGAEYEPHWAFQPPTQPLNPDVVDDTWCRTPVDRHILAALDANNLHPAPEADAETLLRRLFLDVTGLPPTPAELDDFLSDSRPDAYERWVDRLLSEEPYRSRYAEHWAAPWMDAARYGDTCGIHMDAGRQMWLWRDWVLAAIRDNMPYDQFVTEQIAGDLLPDATVEQRIASGFNRNHITTDEGGAISAEYLVEYAVDRVDTTASVFLGLTMACARCHDHKYDPVTQEEFYEFMAFFNSIEEPGLYTQTPDVNRAYEPFIEVPTDDQQTRLRELAELAADLERQMAEVPPEEAAERVAFAENIVEQSGVRWSRPTVTGAASSDDRVSLDLQDDGSLLATGPMPETEDYIIHLDTDEIDQRLILIEALPTPGATSPGAGRAFHGNVVISGISVDVRPRGSNTDWEPVALRWAWADHSQQNLDYEVTNLLRSDETLGWAADGNDQAGQRLLCLMADEPFGDADGTDVRVRIEFRSRYAQHSMGRLRVQLGQVTDEGLAMLPASLGRWKIIGSFKAASAATAFADDHGIENEAFIGNSDTFGPDDQAVRFMGNLIDDAVVMVPGGVGSNYLCRTIVSPDDRDLPISLGSDDGYRLSLNGVEIKSENVNRGAAPNQSTAVLPLRAGMNMLVLRVVNTGGPTGYYFSARRPESVLDPDLVSMLVPADLLGEEQASRLEAVYRRRVSPTFKQAEEELAATRRQEAEVRASIPRTMVMKDLATPRETYVLIRGQYDHPDKERPVTPNLPAVLGRLPEDAPRTRLSLAEWMVAPENPLVARVAVNRIWQTVFGTGLVATSEDFGFQGEWPSHPDLLDMLAVDLIENDWDVQHILRMVLTSSVYRQASHVRDDVAAVDPNNRLLAQFPRRRLSAEQIRDQALYVSGLLVEQVGGPSVKPYQPPGLWREVAMPSSNTRLFERGDQDELWRRSLYTYWKRASPPPSLQTFDAPTREACVIRRPITNTPLQALVLWNDEQYVEASRVLAARTLQAASDDGERLDGLFRRCTGRSPDAEERARLLTALDGFRDRYRAAPADAEQLLMIGEAPRDESQAPEELAAWTVVASAVLSLHETITLD